MVGGSGYDLDKPEITVWCPGGSGVVIRPSAGKGFLTAPTISITSGITGTTFISAGSGHNDGIYNLGVYGSGGSLEVVVLEPLS